MRRALCQREGSRTRTGPPSPTAARLLTALAVALYHRFDECCKLLVVLHKHVRSRKRGETEAENSVIKLDIVNQVAERTGVPKMKAEQAVDALFLSMKEALSRGERIELRGFGVFVVKPRKRGVGRNPRTGEEVAIPSGKTIRFKPGKELQAHGFEGEDETGGPEENAAPQTPDLNY